MSLGSEYIFGDNPPRTVCWFSCGATSAIAAKLVCQESREPGSELVIVYTEVKEEHPDNARFLKDCEGWFGQDVVILRNEKYSASIYEVFRRERYITGPHGSPCTKHLKRNMREKFQRPDDIHVLGFSAEEVSRAEEFSERNHTLTIRYPLIEQHLTKADCLGILERSQIELPALYKLGYDHNNCIGCVKGGKGYWNKIRRDFPETFARMAAMEREIGATVLREKGARIWLDELDPQAGRGVREPSIECGVFCEQVIAQLKGVGDE